MTARFRRALSLAAASAVAWCSCGGAGSYFAAAMVPQDLDTSEAGVNSNDSVLFLQTGLSTEGLRPKTRFEYLGLLPQEADLRWPPDGIKRTADEIEAASHVVSWVRMDYPEGGPAIASDVVLSLVTEATEDLGALFGLSLGSDSDGTILTGRATGDALYALLNLGLAPDDFKDQPDDLKVQGCCADTIRIFSRSTGESRDLNLESLMETVRPGDPTAHATHTMDLTVIDGEPHALQMATYNEAALGNAFCDIILAVRLSDGAVRRTADGSAGFNIFERLGTLSEDPAESIFKMQFNSTNGVSQFHANGLTRFQTRDGLWLLVVNQATLGTLLLKDPFTYSLEEGGGSIVQRFGTPGGSGNIVSHYFGIDEADGISMLSSHNPWHTVYQNRETITVFVNHVSTDSYSHAIEFDLKLVDEADVPKKDFVFNTNYKNYKFSYSCDMEGGARVLSDSVVLGSKGIEFMGADGVKDTGLEIVDSFGGRHTFPVPFYIYDPFVRITDADIAARY